MIENYYIIIFLFCASLTAVLTFFVIKLAWKWDIVDHPSEKRKIHEKPTPLLGGVAIFLAFFLSLFLLRENLIIGDLEYHHWLGFFAGAVFLIIGGFLDDKYKLRPSRQVIWPILAVLCVIAGGVGITKISNPFNDLFYLDTVTLTIFKWGDSTYYLTLLRDAFTFLWLMAMMYTTKLLDGVDGLVSGVVAIGGFIIFLFTTTTQYYQPDIALASLILMACCLGFLIFNWSPAKIFLGEGGSLLLGYLLGVLAIISGGKIAIAFLVLGLPVLDLLWTIIRRLWSGQNPFKTADKKHLHHKLLNWGLSPEQTSLVFYFFALIFGVSALFLQTTGKILAILGLILLMFFLVTGLKRLGSKDRV